MGIIDESARSRKPKKTAAPRRATPKRRFTWSYSALHIWETCPRQYFYNYIEEHPKPPNVYRDEGIRIHKELETFVKKPRARKTPEDLVLLDNYLKECREQGAESEVKVCFDREWREVPHAERWGTIVVDLHWLSARGDYLTVSDLKSGRVRDYSDQGRIYLAGLLSRYPEVVRGHAEFAYSKTGDVLSGEGRPRIVAVDKLEMLGYRRELAVRANRVEADGKFDAKPGSACRWCDFSRKKGGPCDQG